MASIYDKKFKTTETTKSAGTEVVSDPIELSPRSKNHVLSVTSDSSLSGTVDIEMEMSPDGNNWCPAVSRTVSVTPGTSQAARTGNEEYVKLTPDAGEFKNKHCRGGLNFDVNGAVVTPDGSGARDLMDQHISVNKSFNYSQWFKSSEAPTTSYKPVLFRHGGYDDFSNTKVPQLTEASNTGTAPANTKVAKGTSNSGNSITNKDFTLGGTNLSDLPGFLPDIGNYQSDYKRMPSLLEGWSFSWWVKLGETGDTISTNYYVGLWSMGRSASGFFKSYAYNGHIYAGIKVPNLDVQLMCTGTRTAGQWYHCVLTKSAGTGTAGNGNQTDQGTLKFYIDGVLQQEQALGTSLSDSKFHTLQITECSILNANPHSNNNFYRGLGVAEIDEFSSYKDALHIDEITAMSFNGKPVDPTTIPVSGNKNIPSKICTYFKFGDASNDNTSTHVSFNQIDNAYRTANSRSTISTADPGTMTLETYNSRGTLHALDTTESIYNASSVQGSVKTSQNLTGRVSAFSSQFTTINAGTSGAGNIRVTPGSDAATFYGNTSSGTSTVAVSSGPEADIGKHLLGIYKPDVSFSSSRWILINRYPISSGWKHRSGYQHGYPGPNYTASNYIRFYGHISFSPFVTYSPNDAAAKSLKVKPVITGSATGYWYRYANSNGEVPMEFTKAAGGTLTVANIEAGFHVVVTYDPPSTPSNGIPASSVKCYVNGESVAIRTTTENGVDYLEDAAPSDNLFYGDEVYAHDSGWGGAAYLDYGTGSKSTSRINNHMDFSNRVLTQSEAQSLYNGGQLLDFSNMQTSFPISITGCVGAYDADVPLMNDAGYPSIMWGFQDCSPYGKHVCVYDGSITTNQAVQAVSSNYSPGWMALPTPLINTYFVAAAPLSISGWFKTTDSGTLFSNTAGAAADGLLAEVTSTGLGITFKVSGTSQTLVSTTPVNNGNWHHMLLVLDPSHSTKKQRLYVNGLEKVSSNHTLTNAMLKGANGFTLLGDGQITALKSNPPATDASKLGASISNWSIHSEALNVNAAKQLYSNGNVRNIKNLPDVNVAQLRAWWQLNDGTNPQNDLIGTDHLHYQDGSSQTLVSRLVNATDDALVQNTINGNAMTMSLTKSFDFSTNQWVSTANKDPAICVSFNGFEEQAEYFAIWKCSQTVAGSTINILDGNWHNVILSYRGKNNLSGNNVAEGDVVKFGPGPANNLPFNWALSFDGNPLTSINDGSGVDYIGGLNTITTDSYTSTTYNVGFPIRNRHLKYISTNSEEVYKPHAQFGAGIHEVTGVDNNNAFQGSVDETSFHSDDWWVDQAGTTILTSTYNAEKPATIFGNTTALAQRGGTNTDYPEGKPYDLLNPGRLTSGGQLTNIQGTNQFINPARYNASSNPNGGLEGWWRWGDTPGDCSITINDVKDHEDSINARDITAFGIVTADRVDMSGAPESIYLDDRAAVQGSGSAGITFPQVKIEGIQAGVCNIKNIFSPILQYIRVKIKGSGSVDLGEGKCEVKLLFTNRVRRSKR